MIVLHTMSMTWDRFWETVTSARALASYRLSIGASVAAAAVNTIFGMIVAWVLVRYSFPGRRIADALVDLPFAMPTAVGGLALTAIYSSTGWIGRYADAAGVCVAF